MPDRVLGIMVLALILPGAGHWVLGKRARAAIFFAIVAGLFALGLILGGRLYTPGEGGALAILGTIAAAATGLPYFVALAGAPWGNPTISTYEHGTAFALTAGFMNLLLVLDCYDIRMGRKP